MTQEEKQLLLKDLCAKLPYGVQIFVEHDKYEQETLLGVDIKQFSIVFGGKNCSSTSNIEGHHIEQYKQIIKPYLRPMSSMTEEEYNEYELTFDNVAVYSGHNNNNIHSEHRPTYETFDYLDSIHVDYRDLIPKGLALEAPEDMYKIN